jgi:hypothetical protein
MVHYLTNTFKGTWCKALRRYPDDGKGLVIISNHAIPKSFPVKEEH